MKNKWGEAAESDSGDSVDSDFDKAPAGKFDVDTLIA